MGAIASPWVTLADARKFMAEAHKELMNEMLLEGKEKDKNGCYKY